MTLEELEKSLVGRRLCCHSVDRGGYKKTCDSVVVGVCAGDREDCVNLSLGDYPYGCLCFSVGVLESIVRDGVLEERGEDYPYYIWRLEEVGDVADYGRLLSLVKEMRGRQREFFKSRDKNALIESKRLESEVDRCIEELESGKRIGTKKWRIRGRFCFFCLFNIY